MANLTVSKEKHDGLDLLGQSPETGSKQPFHLRMLLHNPDLLVGCCLHSSSASPISCSCRRKNLQVHCVQRFSPLMFGTVDHIMVSLRVKPAITTIPPLPMLEEAYWLFSSKSDQ